MSIDRLVLTAGTVFLIGKAVIGGEWYREVVHYPTKNGKDSVVVYHCKDHDNYTLRRNAKTGKLEKVMKRGGRVMGDGTSLEKDIGKVSIRNNADGSQTRGVVMYSGKKDNGGLGAEEHFERGQKYYENQNYEMASKEFEHAVKLDSLKSEYWNRLGDTYYNLNVFDNALQSYDKCTKLNPNSGNGFLGLGWSHYRLGHNNEAKKAWKRGMDLGDKNSEKNYKWMNKNNK